MNLPLSQEDKKEISEAYQKAAAEIKASAASLDALAEMLAQKMAYLSPGSRQALSEQFNLIGSSLFGFEVLRLKVQNMNFGGREFPAPVATSQEP